MNYSNTENKWNQWLAGVIDGDGYLAIQKNNVAVCEITMPLNDEYLLAQIKKKLGGRIGLRSGAKAVRYRLAHKQGIIELIYRINGSIRNSIRVTQFKNLCSKFKITFITAPSLTLNDGYSAGFFDADGTIYLTTTRNLKKYSTQKGTLGKINRLYFSRGANQLKISISNKYYDNIIIFYNAFRFGRIRKVVQKNKIWYNWELTTELDIMNFYDYLNKFSCESSKNKRIFLIKRYFELKQIQAHLAPEETNLNKAWFLFCKKWYIS